MRFGYSETCLAHDTGTRHPESPDRLRAVREGLKHKHGVEFVEADPAPMDCMAAVHDREYLESVEAFCADGGGNWDPDTSAVEESWGAIRRSAGLACWVAEAACSGSNGRKTPFSLGRPPGHHAIVDDAMGFCFVNNVAVAAQYACDDLGAERVAILDWDVHHGNGTQDIFYDDGDVFVVSIHEKGLYPGTGEVEETGEGAGEGTTMNVPFPSGTEGAGYLAAVEGPMAEALADFGPDLLLVSAGFDAHRHDPISRIRLETEDYARLAESVRTIADDVGASLGFVLEGGYGLELLADSIAIVHDTFDGREPLDAEGTLSQEAADVVEAVREAHGL